jgi:hypothetical protein
LGRSGLQEWRESGTCCSKRGGGASERGGGVTSSGHFRGRRRGSAKFSRGGLGRFCPGNGGNGSRPVTWWRDGILEGEEFHCQGAPFRGVRVGCHVLLVGSKDLLVDG